MNDVNSALSAALKRLAAIRGVAPGHNIELTFTVFDLTGAQVGVIGVNTASGFSDLSALDLLEDQGILLDEKGQLRLLDEQIRAAEEEVKRAEAQAKAIRKQRDDLYQRVNRDFINSR